MGGNNLYLEEIQEEILETSGNQDHCVCKYGETDSIILIVFRTVYMEHMDNVV